MNTTTETNPASGYHVVIVDEDNPGYPDSYGDPDHPDIGKLAVQRPDTEWIGWADGLEHAAELIAADIERMGRPPIEPVDVDLVEVSNSSWMDWEVR